MKGETSTRRGRDIERERARDPRLALRHLGTGGADLPKQDPLDKYCPLFFTGKEEKKK